MGFMPGIAVHPHAVVTTRLFSAVCRRKRRGQGLGGISVSGVLRLDFHDYDLNEQNF